MFELKDFRHFAVAGILIVSFSVVSGCKKAPDAAQVADNTGPDPADVNQAPVGASQPQPYTAAQPARTRVLGQSQSAQPQQTTATYQQAPIERAPDPSNYTPPQTYQNNDPAYQPGDENFDQTIDQYAEQAPPPLPVYEQPPCPEPNYLWTPGYWSYAPTGYFWVPGAWAAPPYSGALWTPGYWGVSGNRYGYHRGFWGLHIGFYGGIAYGFGYTGSGYHGGYWNGNNFYYNRAVNRVNVTNIHNTYVRNVTINNTVINNRISYNGRGGVQARPAAYEVAAMREQHTAPMAAQLQLREQSQQNRQQFFNENKGRPAAIVASRPLAADRGLAAPQRQVLQQAARPEVLNGGQPNRTVQSGFGGLQQRNEVQQRNEQVEQRNFQHQGKVVQQPQRNDVQQRNQQEQRNLQQQQEQRNLQTQQHTLQQQQDQRRNVQMQQIQQHDPQQQQRNLQQQQEQQRNAEVQQHAQQQQDQLRITQQQQHNQQVQRQQQKNDQQQLQQRNEQHNQQQQRTEPQPRVQEQRQQPQPQPQPRAEPQRAAPQPQPQQQPHQEARPAERPHPDGHPPRSFR